MHGVDSRSRAAHLDLRRLNTQAADPINAIIIATDELKLQAGQLDATEASQDLERIALAARTLHTMIAEGLRFALRRRGMKVTAMAASIEAG